MKRLSKYLAAVLALALLATPVLAAQTVRTTQATLTYSDIAIIVDGKEIIPQDVNGQSTEPFSINGTVYLPIRAISEAIGYDVRWDEAANAVVVTTKTNGAWYSFQNNGVIDITDASMDSYFKEGTALTGVEALLDAGRVYVNNQQVPASANDTDAFVINGFPSLWKTGENTWAYSVHKLYSGTDLTFEEARLGFIQGISKMRGLTMELYSEDGVSADRMETTIKESTLVNSMTINSTSTTITRYDFALATDEDRPDVNEVEFPTKNVDPDLKVGDIALYWYDGSEWHIQRAVAETGILVSGTGEEKFVMNGTAHSDALITRYNLQAANRTSQFLTGHTNLGLTDIPVTMWSTETGFPIGFTRGDGDARTALETAVINARNIGSGYKISADGSDVLTTESWVTQETMDAYVAAINAAEAVLDNSGATNIDLDMAIYNLSSALGSATGRQPSGLLGNAKQGSMPVLASIQETGSTPITDASYDKYFKGTAAEGVKEILNAGKFFVNGFALPATESEFNINLGFITLVKTADGSWSSSVHKGNTSDPTFEEARLKLAEGLTKFAGLYVNLFDDNGDGFADRIETTVKQSVRVDQLIVDGDSVKIDRTNFEVAVKEGAEEVNDVVFPASHVDPTLKAGDVGLYWETPDGFYIDRCASKIGRLTEGTDHGYYVFDGVRYEDIGGVTKYHLAKANRPGQFLEAMRTLGLLGQIDVIAWTVGDYQIASFSNIDSAAVLSQGIAAASAAINTAGASADSLAALSAQIAAANTALANSTSTSADLDRAFYELALAVDALAAA
ncbi:MAG: stalk domain-containing protein [Oscillospiraceae bacterium]